MEKGFKTTAKRDLEQGLACRLHGRIRLGKLLDLRHRRFDAAVLQETRRSSRGQLQPSSPEHQYRASGST